MKIFKNLNFSEDFLNISILIKIFENLNLVKIFESCRFRSSFRKKISICVKLSKDPDFRQNFRKIAPLSKSLKISILEKIFEILRFWSICRKFRFWTKFSKNSDYGQNLWKFQVWSKSSKNLEFIWIISISVELSKNLNLCHSIEKSGFGSNFFFFK